MHHERQMLKGYMSQEIGVTYCSEMHYVYLISHQRVVLVQSWEALL